MLLAEESERKDCALPVRIVGYFEKEAHVGTKDIPFVVAWRVGRESRAKALIIYFIDVE